MSERRACAARARARGLAGRRHPVDAELDVARVIDRNPPEQRFLPTDLRIGRQRRDMQHVRHAELVDALLAVVAREGIGDAPVGFFGLQISPEADLVERRPVVAVGEGDVAHVERIVDVLKIVAASQIRIDLEQPGKPLELRIGRKLRCLAIAEKGEDQSEVLSHRPGSDRYPVAEARPRRPVARSSVRRSRISSRDRSIAGVTLDPSADSCVPRCGRASTRWASPPSPR